MLRGDLRVLLGAFGDPGHAFPTIALGAALARRGHDVHLETWARWRDGVEGEGMAFHAAPEYHVFPTLDRPLKPYEAVAVATGTTRDLVRRVAPDVVVADILTLAPALAAELEGVPHATLVPHVDPRGVPGLAPYSIGARPPRTRAGGVLWRGFDPLVRRGLERGRDELDKTRRRLGLPPTGRLHGGISTRLCMIATFPALEPPVERDAVTHVVGPLLWEPPAAEVELPDGPADWPLVLVAPSTSQDPDHSLLRAALAGLADEPVRVLATYNRRLPGRGLRVPANARLVEWISYARTMPRCDVVVCHAGHGTVMRAIASDCVVVACPAAGDMNENAARIDWASCGVRLPRRLVSARGIRLAVARALGEPALAERTAELAAWADRRGPGARAAELVEELAAGP